MPFTTEYSNTINELNIVTDVASENLRATAPVWRQHVVRTEMPSRTTLVEIPKRGELFRLALPENVAYTRGVYGEYSETSIVLSPMKHAIISRVTKEAERFGRVNLPSRIGEEQGKAYAAGAEEDIASLAAAFTANVTPGAVLTQLDLHAAGLEVQIATNNHAVMDSALVAVLHNKSAYEVMVENPLTVANSLDVFANPANSAATGLDSFQRQGPRAGFKGSIGGIDVYATNIVDDDTTNYINLVFDPRRAFVGMWDDSVSSFQDLDIESFRTDFATCWFSDFVINWDEAGCRLEGPV